MIVLGGTVIILCGVLATFVAMGESNKILTDISKTHLTDFGVVYSNSSQYGSSHLS